MPDFEEFFEEYFQTGRLPPAKAWIAVLLPFGDPFWPEEEERPTEILASTPAGGGD